MNFLDRIDAMLAQKDINKNQLAQLTGIPVSTIYGWYKKGYDNITLPTLKKLSAFFGCTMEYLANGDTASEGLSPAALELAKRYDALDKWGRMTVDAVVRVETERCAGLSVEDILDAADAARRITG